jgi:hypothetical protein
MDLATVNQFMARMGIHPNPANLAETIRFVQRAEGGFDCFGTAQGHCDQNDCAWRGACLAEPVDSAPLPPVGVEPVLPLPQESPRRRRRRPAERPQALRV